MAGPAEQLDDAPLAGPMVVAAVVWMIGLAVGASVGWGAGVWLTVAGLAVIAAGLAAWRSGHWPTVAMLALVSLGATGGAWWFLRVVDKPPHHISHFVPDQPRLVELQGIVDGRTYLRLSQSGSMAQFMYSPPATLLVLRVERWYGDEQAIPVTGGVLVRITGADLRIAAGDRLRLIGWLRPVDRAANPGERDFRQYLAREDVVGIVNLKNPGNVMAIERAPAMWTGWQTLRDDIARISRAALNHGMSEQVDPSVRALLDALLLGQRRSELAPLNEAFRESGLAHLLSVSGLHVGLLAAAMWLVVTLVTGRPAWAAVAALATIGLYLLIVPMRVPILRAGLVSAAVCVGLMTGRRVHVLNMLAAVALVMLIRRPMDLFEPGFQLSFGIVVGLIIFVPRVSRRLSERLLRDDRADRPGGQPAIRRWLIDYLAVAIVAWCVALPLVAYHFQLISFIAIPLSLLMYPVVAALLWLGFAKVVVSLIWPAGGAILAGPLTEIGRLCAGAVDAAANMPVASLAVPSPSVGWVLATTVIIAALLAGQFARRRGALALCLIISGTWLFWPTLKPILPGYPQPALRVNMFAVGDGSCYLLRSGSERIMFDCGSATYANLAHGSIIPALRTLGIMRVPTMIVSHADIDHFAGVIDLVDRCGVERVLTNEELLIEAEQAPWTATGYLVEQLERRGVAIEPIRRGWSMPLGRAKLRAIWPPAGQRFERNNDGSLVLLIEAAGRRVLLNGDVAEQAMTMMADRGIDLAADVTDLPHHGSFEPTSPAWLESVSPSIVLQSTGHRRLRYDHWADHLRGLPRWITARHGMVELTIQPDGRIEAQPFQPER
jgi:competence protein ComEC